MTSNIDTRHLDALSGAIYFTVGRGAEGGGALGAHRSSRGAGRGTAN